MKDLDDLPLISTLDPSNFLGTVERFPDQVRAAYQRAHETEGLPEAQGIDSIVVLGMGGSGISGDVCRVVLGQRSPLFIQTLKGYQLPNWVGRNTLVFAVSYSGETEETLETFHEAAQQRGARVVIVSTGGALAARGQELDLPVVFVPPGLQPRAAFGYLSIPILVVCERMGVGPQVGPDILEAITLLEKRSSQYGREVSFLWNPAKQLARRVFGKIPIIYGSEGLAEVAAYRWKCQFNECSKVPAWWHVFPELNHNEIVGWTRLKDITRENAGVIVLRHEGEHPRIARRIEVTIPLIERSLGYVEVVSAEGSSVLARLFDLTYLGDFVATYLGLAQGVDPGPVDIIQDLKRELAVED